jgi:hypothetical protein
MLKPHVKSYAPMVRYGISNNGMGEALDRVVRGAEGCLGLRLPG